MPCSLSIDWDPRKFNRTTYLRDGSCLLSKYFEFVEILYGLCEFGPMIVVPQQLSYNITWARLFKITMSLVNVSLKFPTLLSDMPIFLLKKCEKPLLFSSHFLNKKYQQSLLYFVKQLPS